MCKKTQTLRYSGVLWWCHLNGALCLRIDGGHLKGGCRRVVGVAGWFSCAEKIRKDRISEWLHRIETLYQMVSMILTCLGKPFWMLSFWAYFFGEYRIRKAIKSGSPPKTFNCNWFPQNFWLPDTETTDGILNISSVRAWTPWNWWVVTRYSAVGVTLESYLTFTVDPIQATWRKDASRIQFHVR